MQKDGQDLGIGNKIMIPSSTFYLVSDSAHIFFALSAMLLGNKFSINSWWVYAAILIVFAIKEAFIDPKTETIIVTGSGLRDWLGYLLGATIGLFLCIYW